MKQPPTKKPRSSTKYRDKREAKPPKNSEGEKDVEEDDVLSSSDSDIDMEALEKYQRGAPVDHKVRPVTFLNDISNHRATGD